MNKRNWKIIYSNYTGMERKAIELVSTEMGRQLNRDKGVFTLHVLACEKTDIAPNCNFAVIGRYETSTLIQKYISKNEIQKDGYIVKVMDNPENEDLKIAVIAGDTDAAVFYGAVEFVDDYFSFAAPHHVGLRMTEEIFEQKRMPDYYNTSSPKFKTRSVFTWGQPINDYRAYIENMARLKLNQLIIWNDFIPVNADEVVDYAHEYGIEVLWGYAWGWKPATDEALAQSIMSELPALKKQVIDEYSNKYKNIKGDGIYFQSFTEFVDEAGGKIIAQVVTDFVNETARELYNINPDLHIQFGLHAPGVKNKLEYIANVDERIEILWEDCGSFPYNYNPATLEGNSFEETCEFTDKIINLREVNPLGLVFKGQMTMDWDRFVHQSGPYILGKESPEIVQHDKEMMAPIWRVFQAEWMRYGEYAHKMANKVLEQTDGNVNMCVAGTLSGGIWLPYAITAQLFWDCTIPYNEMLETVSKRKCITMA